MVPGAGEQRWRPPRFPSMDGPNPITVGVSVVKSLRVRKPRWHSTAPAPDYGRLGLVLDTVRRHGVPALGGLLDELDDYTADVSTIAPTELSRMDALAYWLNLYNAGALTLAGEATATNERSVLRLPGAFTRPFTIVEGESVSLNDIEHGKIRRFGEPRIHSALVCGSASCPTLRYEPFDGGRLDSQLDDQMGSFLAGGRLTPRGRRSLAEPGVPLVRRRLRSAWSHADLPAGRQATDCPGPGAMAAGRSPRLAANGSREDCVPVL